MFAQFYSICDMIEWILTIISSCFGNCRAHTAHAYIFYSRLFRSVDSLPKAILANNNEGALLRLLTAIFFTSSNILFIIISVLQLCYQIWLLKILWNGVRLRCASCVGSFYFGKLFHWRLLGFVLWSYKIHEVFQIIFLNDFFLLNFSSVP